MFHTTFTNMTFLSSNKDLDLIAFSSAK